MACTPAGGFGFEKCLANDCPEAGDSFAEVSGSSLAKAETHFKIGLWAGWLVRITKSAGNIEHVGRERRLKKARLDARPMPARNSGQNIQSTARFVPLDGWRKMFPEGVNDDTGLVAVTLL